MGRPETIDYGGAFNPNEGAPSPPVSDVPQPEYGPKTNGRVVTTTVWRTTGYLPEPAIHHMEPHLARFDPESRRMSGS